MDEWQSDLKLLSSEHLALIVKLWFDLETNHNKQPKTLGEYEFTFLIDGIEEYLSDNQEAQTIWNDLKLKHEEQAEALAEEEHIKATKLRAQAIASEEARERAEFYRLQQKFNGVTK